MEELKKQLINVINNSNLHIEMIYYVLKDVYRELENAYFNYLNNLQNEQQIEHKEKIVKGIFDNGVPKITSVEDKKDEAE